MEQTLSSHHPDQIEEKDITLVLEQLQENGFSSFFDHPDCPFSSIQEVDEALKELEKEFLKICVEQDVKPSEVVKKSKISVTTSSASNNRYKSKSKRNELKKDNKYRYGTLEKLNKKDIQVKKPDNPKFGLPSTSRSSSLSHTLTDRAKFVNPAECGDSKDVCGIDSCGNKYSLKIEVFATVKLEAENKNVDEKCKNGSKIIVNKSKLKRNDSGPAFNHLVIPNKDQTDSCAPLVLNYRSSVCKPCPSYMYPTACDLRKNILPQKRKVESLAKDATADDKNYSKAVTSSKSEDLNEPSSKTLEKVSIEEIQREVQIEDDSSENYNFEKNMADNYSVVKEHDESFQELTDIKASEQIKNHSTEVQTSIQDSIFNFDVYNTKINDLKNDEPPKMFDQEQQTSFENTLLPCHEDEIVTEVATPDTSSTPKYKMIDKEVETSLFLLFDQNLINELKGLGQMIASNVINEDNYEDVILNENINISKNINNVINTNRKNDNNLYDLEAGKNKGDTLCDKRSISGNIRVGTDPLNFVKQDSYVEFQLEKTKDDASCNSIELSDEDKSDSKDLSDSSSIETVILIDGGSISEFNIVKRGVLDGDIFTDEISNAAYRTNSGVNVSRTFDQGFSVVNEKFDFIDIAVGPSYEMFPHITASTLVKEKVKSMPDIFSGKENINGKTLESEQNLLLMNFKKIALVDKEVGMSRETLCTLTSRKMVNKEVRAASIDSLFVTPKTIMIDKEIGPESKSEDVEEKEMIDKEIETVVQSKSMSTNIVEATKKLSFREMGTGISKHSGVLKSKNEEPTSEKDVTVDSKFAKWSKAKVPLGQKLFKKPDSKSNDSDKFIKLIKERREKKKSEGSVKSRESSTKKDKRKQEEDKDLCSTSSLDRVTRQDKDRWKEISEYETKFVKGVFARRSYSAAAKNKVALRRRAFSNLDQKIMASKLAKSRKMLGSLKSSKKSSWERSKSHSGVKIVRKQPSKELSSCSGEYHLPENTVINATE